MFIDHRIVFLTCLILLSWYVPGSLVSEHAEHAHRTVCKVSGTLEVSPAPRGDLPGPYYQSLSHMSSHGYIDISQNLLFSCWYAIFRDHVCGTKRPTSRDNSCFIEFVSSFIEVAGDSVASFMNRRMQTLLIRHAQLLAFDTHHYAVAGIFKVC